jgi:hypothetical protein
MLRGSVWSEPGGSKLMIVACCARAQRLSPRMHEAKQRLRAIFRFVVKDTWARADRLASIGELLDALKKRRT